MEMNDLKDIYNFIKKFEAQYSIFDFRVLNGIPFWAYIRPSVAEEILINKHLIDAGSPSRGFTVRKIISTVYNGIADFLFLLKKRNVSYLFFETPRRIANKEPYLSPIYDKISSSKYIRFCYTEKWTYDEKNVLHLNFLKLIAIFISTCLSPLFFLFVGLRNNKLIINITNDLNVNSKIWFYKMKFFELNFWYYVFLFTLKVTRPKKVFMVSSTFYIPLIAACDKLNILTYEIQHGIVSKYSFDYNFSELKRDFFFPSYLLLLGNEWNFVESFLPSGTKTRVLGSSIADEINSRSRYDQNTILFISQKTIRKYIIDFINNNKWALENYKIVYKLHPMEYNDRELILSNIPKELKNNFQIIGNEATISELFNNSIVQIGSYSAAMLEGIQSGIPSLMIKTPLSNHLHFVQSSLMKTISSDIFNELEEYIKNSSTNTKSKKIEYYTEYNEDVLNEIITI